MHYILYYVGTAVNDDTITQNNMIEVTLDNVPSQIDATCIDIPSTSRLGNLLNFKRIRYHFNFLSSNFDKIPQNHDTFENHFLVKRVKHLKKKKILISSYS